MRSILDPAFRYVPSFATSVAATWRRFGWRPTTDEDRKTRGRPDMELVSTVSGQVMCCLHLPGLYGYRPRAVTRLALQRGPKRSMAHQDFNRVRSYCCRISAPLTR